MGRQKVLSPKAWHVYERHPTLPAPHGVPTAFGVPAHWPSALQTGLSRQGSWHAAPGFGRSRHVTPWKHVYFKQPTVPEHGNVTHWPVVGSHSLRWHPVAGGQITGVCWQVVPEQVPGKRHLFVEFVVHVPGAAVVDAGVVVDVVEVVVVVAGVVDVDVDVVVGVVDVDVEVVVVEVDVDVEVVVVGVVDVEVVVAGVVLAVDVEVLVLVLVLAAVVVVAVAVVVAVMGAVVVVVAL